ncbi:MAG: FRG domain-containing protein [Syntrophobacteraceae bacterium]
MDEDIDHLLKDGVCVVTLSSWQEFHQKVNSLKSKRGYVWRGQRKDELNSWFLRSSFDRKVQIANQNDRTEKLKFQLHNFKKEMNKSHPNVLLEDDVDIWALGQHYGLRTPLLDWTLSPYIAAYFAFNEKNDANDASDRYRYVYALNRSLERLMSKQKKANEILSSDRSVPFIDKLPYPSPRFTAQKGIFTKAFLGRDIREYVHSFSRKRPSEIIIMKFEIPSTDREECLYELHLMNIDHMSLLLDIRDVVDLCNNKLS